MSQYLSAYLMASICIFLVAAQPVSPLVAHIFISSDDTVSFLTLIERVRVEALLANNTSTYNGTLTRQHIEQLLDRLDDAVDRENDFSLKTEAFSNATINALVLANVVDEVLRYYGGSFGLLPNALLNMSLLVNNSQDKTAAMVDELKYQTSFEYAKRALELFEIKLKNIGLAESKNATEMLEENLIQLQDAVYNKLPPMQIMDLAHTKIHPLLQKIFGLQLIG